MALHVNSRTVETDDEGYLLNPADWDTEVADTIARQENLEMIEHRWEVVNFVRKYYEERQSVPEARVLLKNMQAVLGKEKGTRKYLYELFPYGYGQQACKIAGMRKPLKLMLDL